MAGKSRKRGKKSSSKAKGRTVRPADKPSGSSSRSLYALLALLAAVAVGYVLVQARSPPDARSPVVDYPQDDEDLDVWEWDVAKVATYVRRLGPKFKRFAGILEQNKIDGSKVLDLLDSDVEKLGLRKKNVRNKMMDAIYKLRKISGMEGVMTLQDALRRNKDESLSGKENPDNTNFGATDKVSFARLNRWLYANGADLKKVYLDPEQRILRTRRNIKKGETVLTVPPNLFMSTVLARADSKVVQILEKEMDLGTHSLISIYMLEEIKNKESTFWQPYINVLPQRYNDIPIFWDEAESSELQGDALSRYHRRSQTLKNDYDKICKVCPGFADTASLEEFMWARTAVITRTFGLKVNDVKITTNLPIDFLMHANQPDTTWGYDQTKGCYHITATRDIPKNKFLTITYGKKANARFLVNYGFCLPTNSRNKGFVALHSANSFMGIGENNGEGATERYELEISHDKVDEIIRFSRTIVADHCKRNDITGLWNIQYEAWKYLRHQVKQELDSFPTTLAHDLEQLKRDDISQNVRNALLARSGEKTVTDFYYRLADAAITRLEPFLESEKDTDVPADERKQKRNAFAKEMFGFPKQFTDANLIIDPTID